MPVSINTKPPVLAAENALSKSHVETLWAEKVTRPWEEKVTQNSWVGTASKVMPIIPLLAKIPGLISYLWNRSTAVEADKKFGATITEYNAKLATLVNKVAERALTQTESASIDMNGNIGALKTKDQLNRAERVLVCQKAEDEFYKVFKERCTQLNVNQNGDDFGVHFQGALNSIMRQSESEACPHKNALKLKIETTCNSLSSLTYLDILTAFATQPAESITREGYVKKTKQLHGLFSGNTQMGIETAMRRAILENHTSQELLKLAAEYAAADPANPKVATVRQNLKDKFEAEQAALEAELEPMRGPNKNDGTLHTTSETMKKAGEALDTARTKFKTEYAKQYGVNPTSDDEALAVLVFNASQAVQDAHADFLEKLTLFKDAKKAFDDLKAEHSKLTGIEYDAQGMPKDRTGYDGAGNVIGGKIGALKAKLLDLDRLARDEASKTAKFYKELSTEASAWSFNAMQAILNDSVSP
jgi:hypothetical protein